MSKKEVIIQETGYTRQIVYKTTTPAKLPAISAPKVAKNSSGGSSSAARAVRRRSRSPPKNTRQVQVNWTSQDRRPVQREILLSIRETRGGKNSSGSATVKSTTKALQNVNLGGGARSSTKRSSAVVKTAKK
ncbi:hypothetical protein KM043_007575 [Ampulex compressa]|nr:hypothetical protein KM043_007575 [Ampulex compressa]